MMSESEPQRLVGTTKRHMQHNHWSTGSTRAQHTRGTSFHRRFRFGCGIWEAKHTLQRVPLPGMARQVAGIAYYAVLAFLPAFYFYHKLWKQLSSSFPFYTVDEFVRRRPLPNNP